MVVIGHASYYTIKTKFGGIYYDQMMLEYMVDDTLFHRITSELTNWIYVFHMPAYFCLSGVIFSIEMKKTRYSSLQELAVAKAKRLLLPMLFVWVVWNIPIKMLSGYYSGLTHPLAEAVLQIVFPNAVYLWFLEALFFCFIMDYVLVKMVRKCSNQFIIVGLLGLIGLLFYKYIRQITPLGNPIKWLVWFWLGHYIDSVRDNLNGLLKKYFNISANAILAIETTIFIVTYFMSFRVLKTQWIINNTILSFVGIIWVWELSEAIYRLFGHSKKFKKQMLQLSAVTYGVYLWAEPLNYLVLAVTVDLFGIAVFGKESGAVMIYGVRAIGSVLIAILITKLLKKLKFPIKAY